MHREGAGQCHGRRGVGSGQGGRLRGRGRRECQGRGRGDGQCRRERDAAASTECWRQAERSPDAVAAVAVPVVDTETCSLCGLCESVCLMHAIRVDDSVHIDLALCTGCGDCLDQCPVGAIEMKPPDAME